MTLRTIWRAGLTFIPGLLLTASLPGQSPRQPLFFAQVGAGTYADLDFRTEFHLSNENPEKTDGQLSFFSHEGTPEDFQVTGHWTGDPGELHTDGNRAVFSLLPGTGLTLTLGSKEGQISIGWAKLEGSGQYSARALFQQAEAIDHTNEPGNFEDRLIREVEVTPSTGLKDFSFPISLFQGHQEINTAFALVNLSSQKADLSIRLRPDQVETVTVQPGHLFSSYFTDFWQLAFPAIFPLRVSFLAEVQSEVPWAVTVFRTRQGLPLSGVPPTPMSIKEETIQAELGQEFELSVNQAAQISSESLEISFQDVTEDSRCPIGATCIWEGQASIVIRVSKDGEVLGDFTLTSRAGYTDLATLEIGGHVIQLLDVAPVPEIGKDPIGVSDYVVTLVVK